MSPTARHWRQPLVRLSSWLPRSLRGQFTLALTVLSLLMLAGGFAAIYALRTSSDAIRQLTQERLARMHDGQDLVQRTLLIERETGRLLSTDSLPAVQLSYAAIVEQTAALDRVVTEMANADDDVGVLDLYQASQLFRNTTNVVAQLSENKVQTEKLFAQLISDRMQDLTDHRDDGSLARAQILDRLRIAGGSAAVETLRAEFARLGAPSGRRSASSPDALAKSGPPSAQGINLRDPFSVRLALDVQRGVLARFHELLSHQAEAMVSAARVRATFFDADYRSAAQLLVDASHRQQRWILVLLAASLLFAWLVAGVFLGRHVLGRLQLVSLYLQQRNTTGSPLAILAHERDEIGAMASAVHQFLADRAQLETRTAELFITEEHLVEQGNVLEMIATSQPLPDVLDRLTRLIESQLEGIQGSILLLDEDGLHLRHGAGPHLPLGYVRAIDGVRIGPSVGSCGTAAHRGEPVMVSDIQADPLWADYRALAAEHGLRSCWSAPILSQQDVVLGTFAMYSAEVRTPSEREERLVDLATRIAGIAIERNRSEERFRHIAHHDALTGLPNRLLLNSRMSQALALARRSGSPLALLFLDLDGFKFINDSFGHPAGDAVLIAAADRLTASVREGDTVARLGGDEFVVMLLGLERAQDAVTVAEKILSAFGQPWLIESQSMRVNASIGISVYPGDGGDSETLLKHADVALYRAKQRGRNWYQCYTEDMGEQARQSMELRTALQGALEGHQFELHYQPQVDLRSGRMTSMEALIRWHHPELGAVSPARFIPMAEETGIIVLIGEWVLRTACMQLRAWHGAGHDDLSVAVNLSARQFQGHDIAQLVRRVLDESGLPARFLELELTESALMQDTGSVLHSLQELKSMGVVLALDDFGTGYSSLSHLMRFPIDVIKIDQSFTSDVTVSEDAAAITRAIIAMAQSLGVKTVAEGVETEEQLRFMQAHQCDCIQGYYFSRPLPLGKMSALLSGDRILATSVESVTRSD